MKTVTITFVVEDDEKECLDREIQEALENTDLKRYALRAWTDRKSTKQETTWYAKQNKAS